MRGRSLDTAPDYTNAALVMAFINLLWMLGLLLVLYGLPALLVAAVALNWLIGKLDRSEQRQSRNGHQSPDPQL